MTYAARLNGMASIVRVPSAEAWTIERHMMRDVDGIVVPRLDTAAQAAKAVEDIRYACPGSFGQKAVIIQIESSAAIRELDAFLAIREIDCLFIGAVDLSKSMGFEGDYSRPEVTAAMRAAIAEIRRQGKSAGFMVTVKDVRSWREAGANMLYFHLNDCIRLGLRDWKSAAGLEHI
jgi:2-keto-3-deoxy-L-rhamnonate aldolase RhmA